MSSQKDEMKTVIEVKIQENGKVNDEVKQKFLQIKNDIIKITEELDSSSQEEIIKLERKFEQKLKRVKTNIPTKIPVMRNSVAKSNNR